VAPSDPRTRERRSGWGSHHRGHSVDVEKRRGGYAYIILAVPAHSLAQGTATVEEQRLSRREIVSVMDGPFSRRPQALDRLEKGLVPVVASTVRIGILKRPFS
jgi:hypothetical protein